MGYALVINLDPELVEASVPVLQSLLSIHVPFGIMQVSKLRRLQTSLLLSSSQAEHFPNVKEHGILKTFWGGSVQNTILSQSLSSFSLDGLSTCGGDFLRSRLPLAV